MSSWDEKAREAFYKRQEEIEQRTANRLAALLSNMLEETVPPSGNKIKLADIGDILINGKKPHENCPKKTAPPKYPTMAERAE